MQIIKLETAMLAKEKGFNHKCLYAYCEIGGFNKYTKKHEDVCYVLRTNGNPFGIYEIGNDWNRFYMSNKNKIKCSAPTQSELHKWIRENHNILIGIDIDDCDFYFLLINIDKCAVITSGVLHGLYYKTYEEALEAGLQKALELI